MPDNKNTNQTSNQDKTVSAKKRQALSPLQIAAWFLGALIFISIGGGYYIWEFVNDNKNSLEQNIVNNKTEIELVNTGLTTAESNLQNQIKQLTTLQSDLSENLHEILLRNTHMKKDWLVSEAKYLVKLAANRLALEGDIPTAITALNSADTRLLETGDPGLFILRQEISNNVTTLKAIPKLDISGMSFKISSVFTQVDKLPLVTPDPESIKQTHIRAKQDAENNQAEEKITEAFDVGKVINKVVKDITGLIRVRKHDQLVQPLLTKEQRVNLSLILKLQLEQARTALLHTQETTFHERLNESISLIEFYFDVSKPVTVSTIEILAALNKTSLTQEMPDLTAALNMFDHYQGGVRLNKKSKRSKLKKKSPIKAKSNKKSTKIKSRVKKTKTIKSTPHVKSVNPVKPAIQTKPMPLDAKEKTESKKVTPTTPTNPGVSL